MSIIDNVFHTILAHHSGMVIVQPAIREGENILRRLVQHTVSGELHGENFAAERFGWR